VAREVGQIAPGRWADILIVKDLPELKADLVIARGRLAAEGEQVLLDRPFFDYPDWVHRSVRLGRRLKAGDFRLGFDNQNGSRPASVMANVIGVIENQAPTRHLRIEVPFIEGEVKPSLEHDLAKLALVERHQGTGRLQVGLVQGFGFSEPCAIGARWP
jgi:adenine deaminase